MLRVIHIEPMTPGKPAMGDVCNGCGVCCLHEPCPLGAVLSGRMRGACAAVIWDAASSRYRCGAVAAPAEMARQRLPDWLAPLRPILAALLARQATRWIAAGRGCDCDLEPVAVAAEAGLDGATSAQPVR